MKKTHIFGLVVVAIAIAVIASTAGDASSYVSFSEAKNISQINENKKIHVVGHLKKTQEGEIIGIEKSPDQMAFKFLMVDQNNFEQQVIYPNPMPTDFERSEQVVVIGAYQDETFVADKILLKCPSKYQEEELSI